MSSEYIEFQQVWREFLSTKKIDFNQIGKSDHLDIEFDLLDDFSDEQNIRYRPYIQLTDRHEDCRPYFNNKISLLNGSEMSASLIKLPNYQDFIATQAYFEESIHLFWQMIVECEIDQIVMLTELLDYRFGNKELASAYWPQNVNEKLILDHDIEITLLEEKHVLKDVEEFIYIRKFNLCYQNENRVVLHYWYRNWTDNTAPKHTETLLTLINQVQNDKDSLQSQSPIMVHCSAGVGRTGVFIALYHLIQRQKAKDNKINLFNFVAYLRWQRPYLVATPCQYRFCHHVNSQLSLIEQENLLIRTP